MDSIKLTTLSRTDCKEEEISKAFGKNIATNTDGSDRWKYLIYNSSTNKWSIEEKKARKVSFNSLFAQYKSLGVDVTP